MRLDGSNIFDNDKALPSERGEKQTVVSSVQ